MKRIHNRIGKWTTDGGELLGVSMSTLGGGNSIATLHDPGQSNWPRLSQHAPLHLWCHWGQSPMCPTGSASPAWVGAADIVGCEPPQFGHGGYLADVPDKNERMSFNLDVLRLWRGLLNLREGWSEAVQGTLEVASIYEHHTKQLFYLEEHAQISVMLALIFLRSCCPMLFFVIAFLEMMYVVPKPVYWLAQAWDVDWH